MLLAGGCALTSAALVRARRPRRNRPLFSYWYGVQSRRAEQGQLGERRRRLLEEASGRLLDLGVGTGADFAHIPGAVTAVVGVDPDPFMLRQARRRVGEARVPVRCVRAVGEQLPFPDGRFDSAIVTLVLCTVDDLEATISELRRVLLPGGRLLLMEHVRAHDEDLARWQDRFERPWYWCNGGCRPNRRTVDALRDGGFQVGPLEVYGFPALPHVQGVAVRQ